MLLKVGVHLEIIIELLIQSLYIIVEGVQFTRAIMHFLSIEYNVCFKCKRGNQ